MSDYKKRFITSLQPELKKFDIVKLKYKDHIEHTPDHKEEFEKYFSKREGGMWGNPDKQVIITYEAIFSDGARRVVDLPAVKTVNGFHYLRYHFTSLFKSKTFLFEDITV